MAFSKLPRRPRSFFHSLGEPYYILAADFRHSSAGIRCLHYLCHALNELGEEAYLANTNVTAPGLRTPLLTSDVIRRHFLEGRNPVAVYPEVASGNPLQLPTVARWLLNKPGHLGGDSKFDENDLLYYYSPWCLPQGEKGTHLFIRAVDTGLFNNRDNPHDEKRSGALYYANKYLVFGGEIREEHRNATSLGHDIRRTPEEIAALLRKSEVLYCYEQSSIIHESLACGCPVLLVPSPYMPVTRGTDTVFLLRCGDDVYDACYHEIDKREVTAEKGIRRFDKGSAFFNRPCHLIVAPSEDFHFAQGDFTIEGWFYCKDAESTNPQTFIRNSYDAFDAGSWYFGKHPLANGRVSFLLYNASPDRPTLQDFAFPPSNAWVHYAVVRSGQRLVLYRDGKEVSCCDFEGQVTLSKTGLVLGTFSLGNDDPSNAFYGYMEDLRVSRTAKYKSDFSPPQAPHPDPGYVSEPLLAQPGIGVASGNPLELSMAKTTLGKVQAWMEAEQDLSWGHVVRFIEQTQEAAKGDQALDKNPVPTIKHWLSPTSHRKHVVDTVMSEYASVSYIDGRNQQAGPTPATFPVNISGADLHLFNQRSTSWSSPPVFHLILIQGETTDAELSATLAGLGQQPYAQLCITVISQKPSPGDIGQGRLEWWTTTDDPLLVANEAIKKSAGNWCALVYGGDQLAPHALLSIAEYIHTHPDTSALYTDEDSVDAQGNHTRTLLKPDFDLDLLLAAGYTGGLLVARKESWIAAGGLRTLPMKVAESDAALRLAYVCSGLGHIPGVLYHRNASSPVLNPPTEEVDKLRVNATREILQAVGVEARVELGLTPGVLSISAPLKRTPGISIVVPTCNNLARLDKLISTILSTTHYSDYELVVVDNETTDESTRTYLTGLAEIDPARIRVVRNPGPINLAASLNFGASAAAKELLLFVHDDVFPIHGDWLANMIGALQRPGTTMVGARLISPDGATIEEAGIVPMQAGILDRPFRGWPTEHPAPLGRLHALQRVSAISAACMLVSKDDFQALGGMDSDRFPDKFADLDFCLKVKQAGGGILWTPYATLVHDTDNTTWGDKTDNNALLAKWGKTLVNNPVHNPYIALGGDTMQPEAEPVFIPDLITWHPLPNVYSMSSDRDGAGHYRVIQPVQEATQNALIRGRYGMGYPVPTMMEKLDIDVVFSQRQLEDRQLDNLARFKKLLRCKLVMDFDDLLTNVPDKNIHKRTLLKDMKGRLRRVGELAHRFTVSTEPLAREFKQFHDDIRVVPNALLRSQWAHLTSQRGTSRKLRVGWAGGVSHQGDLEVVRDVVKDLAGEVEWVFMGMCLKELNPHIKEFNAGAPFNTYPEELAKLNLDLAIAPLELNPFNECKSHLRILEYGILGIPVIATNITPYQSGFPITLVKNKHQDWVKAIREHINDVDETYKRGDALRQYILDNWMLDQHLETWRAAWDV